MVDTAPDTDEQFGEVGGTFQSIREKIQAADDVTYKDVEVPEWDVTVRIFSMNGKERSEFLAPFASNDPENESEEDLRLRLEAMTPHLLVQTVYDPEGGEHPQLAYRVFRDGDQDWLVTKNSGVTERLGAVALKLSGLDKDARERAGKD